jgi:hypothetical protein
MITPRSHGLCRRSAPAGFRRTLARFGLPLSALGWAFLATAVCVPTHALAGDALDSALTSDDAYVRQQGKAWVIGTAAVERTLAMEDGRLLLRSFKNKRSGRELIPVGAMVEEISAASLGAEGAGPWQLQSAKPARLKQGELQLDLTLSCGPLTVTKIYVIYPGSSIIREWVTLTNAGKDPIKVVEPSILNVSARPGAAESLDFHWMTGGENQPGSWVLKTEKLDPAKPRKFDSYEPFAPGTPAFLGDGIDAKITLNGKQVWPEKAWQYVPNATVTVPFDLQADVTVGDKLAFLVNLHANIGWDTTAFDPSITYTDGETHVASKEFSDKQGQHGWQYQFLEGDRFVDLVYYPAPKQWRKAKDNATGTPFVGQGDQHPDVGQDAARVWTVPKAGRVRLTGAICNTGNRSGAGGGYGFRMGTSTYAPWYALLARDTRDGLVIGWDYFGHWTSSFRLAADGTVTAQLKVAGHRQSLAPGESVTSPKAFVGLFREDLDEAGNEVLDWQYRYLWDYTREGWFPAIRMLGYWFKGTGWGQPGAGWTGGGPDLESTFRKVFRVADLMCYTGADVYHRDWGWWDRAGDWNGPDFRATGDYLRKHGMGQLIYAFLYTVDLESQVARQHPDWVLGGSTLDLSRPEVVAHLRQQLDAFVARWGDFEWRNDSTPTCPRNGDDTPLLGQDAGLREVLRGFLDKYPGCAFQAVNGGGNNAGYDYARYASTVSFSDGAVGIIRNYYAALLLPPDKTSDIPDIWNPNNYDKAIWRGLLCINFDMTGDTWEPAKLEGIRELIDIYHYLHKHGVVGRGVRVHRPAVTGDDATMYFQRLSGDRRRGIIIPKRPAPGAVTIRPKGLLPAEKYSVTFQESAAQQERGGADLMEQGIVLEKMPPGELIYLNLPLHPGSQLDSQAPGAPGDVQQRRTQHMGYPGIELTWKPGTDDNWISYYEVLRDTVAIDKVAKGTYYFDHSAGADLAACYAVRTVDGAGNRSSPVTAQGQTALASRVLDDADPTLKYTGPWQLQTGLQPAHAGTLSTSDQQGAAVAVAFEGKRILWFSKLGDNCGKAEVSVDGGPPEQVDTYSADDIWGVCVYRQELPQSGKHSLRIVVTGDRHPRAKGALIHVDGIRAEPE